MPEKIRRVRRRRRSHPLPGAKSFLSLQLYSPPLRVLIYVIGAAAALALITVFGTYGSKFYIGWRETRLLKRASAMLENKDFAGADRMARQVLRVHQDSIPAFYILADATEKQNSEETVSWRAQIARLQ